MPYSPSRPLLAVALLGLAACAGESATAPSASPDIDVDGRPIAAPAAAPAGFAVQSLGTLGGDLSWAHDVNADGVVVGRSTLADGSTRGFRWTAAGGMVELPTLGGDYASAESINGLGYVTGASRTASGELHVVLWTPSGEVRDLGTVSGGFASGRSINDRNQIAGSVLGGETSNFTQHVVTWSESTGLVEEAFGCTDITAAAITTAGDLAGTTECAPNKLGDYGIWRRVAGGAIEPIGGVPGAWNTLLTAMNDRGVAVGYSQDDATGVISAWAWEERAGFRLLLQDATASDVSERGEVVGGGQPLSGSGGAYYWSRQSGVVALPGLGGELSGTEAMSPDGRYVAGYALDESGAWRAVLWTRSSAREVLRPDAEPARARMARAAVAAKPAPCTDAVSRMAPGAGFGCRMRMAAGATR
jgi:probable HAF family extracellular repeat protein